MSDVPVGLGGSPVQPGINQSKPMALTETLKLAWQDEDLRSRIMFILGVFAVYALCIHVVTPIPGVSASDMDALARDNAFLGLMNMLGGGAFKKLSIMSLGLGPYISASIVMQVAQFAIPSIKEELKQGGEYARKQQNRRTRALTLILCIAQSIGLFTMIGNNIPGFTPQPYHFAIVAAFWTAGAFLLLWLGEQASDKGIGNGVSLLIFAGIVISLPQLFGQINENLGTVVQWWQLVVITILFLATTWFIVMFTQAQRRIPIQHMRRNFGTKSMGGQTSYLPISVNMAGVIPIIFAIALIYMPAQVASAIPPTMPLHETFVNIANFMNPDFTRWQGVIAALIYTMMIFGFTFLWNAMIYNVEDIADNLKRAGSYIPGVRPGKQTKEFLNGVITRVTFVGALFLSAAALTQYVFPLVVKIPMLGLLGGTSLLIMVSVALETMRQIEANLLVKQYGG